MAKKKMKYKEGSKAEEANESAAERKQEGDSPHSHETNSYDSSKKKKSKKAGY